MKLYVTAKNTLKEC